MNGIRSSIRFTSLRQHETRPGTEHRWHLSPACDLTPCTGISGEHCSTVNGKGKDISDAGPIGAVSVGGVGARKVKEMIEQVGGALGEMDKLT